LKEKNLFLFFEKKQVPSKKLSVVRYAQGKHLLCVVMPVAIDCVGFRLILFETGCTVL
jgi:hypothetical protein